MADISQITLPDNNIYYIKDATARDDIADLSAAMPTKTSDLTNDSGFITGYTETDPTVPAWAKQSTKPSYTASEVGALPNTTSYVSSFNGSTGAITYTAPVTSVNGSTGAVVIGDFTSASGPGIDGTHGLVPAPTASDFNNYLNGKNGWAAISANHITKGVLPAAQLPDATTSTRGGVIVGSGLSVSSGIISAPDMTGATSSAAGVHGLVPAPAAGDQNKVLTGNGTWSTVPKATDSTIGGIIASQSEGFSVDSLGYLKAARASATSDGFMTASQYNKLYMLPTATELASTYQAKLVSGTNIKTINNESLLGSGNITISGGSSLTITRYTDTFSTTGWTSESGGGYSKTMQITGAYDAQNIDANIDLNTSGMTASTADTLQENWSKIGRITLTSSGLTAYCYDTAPTIALPFILTVTR